MSRKKSKNKEQRTMTTMTKSRNMRIALMVAVIAALTLTLFLCVFLHAPAVAYADAPDNTFTTTDKLYISLPEHDHTEYLTTLGGYVNGYWDEKQQAQKTSKFSVNSWYDIYMSRSDGWYVPKSDEKDGKYYYDGSKFSTDNATLYLEVRDIPRTENLMGFLWNNTDKIFYREGAPSSSNCKLCRGTCSDLGTYVPFKFKIKKNSGEFVDKTPDDSITYNNDACYPNSGDEIGDTSWKIAGSNDFSTGFGEQPTTGEHILCSASDFIAATYTIHIQYLFSAVCLPGQWSYGKGQTAHYVMPNDSYKYDKDISFTTYKDTAKPTLTVTNKYSKTSVSARWTDDSYSFATYTLNGTNQGEYTKDKTLSTEGKYAFTVKDSVGNTATETVYVDKTAPKFESAFYDAAGTPVVRASKTSAAANWSNAGTNESPIKSCTYVRYYNDAATNSVKSDVAKTYTKNTALTAEGKYVFTLEDSAGNSSTATYIVDKTAPVINAGNIASKTSVSATSTYSNAETAVTMTYSLNGASAVAYTSGRSLTAEGKYVITATDAVGNSSTATLYVDKTAPVLNYTETSRTSVSATWTVGANESPVTATYVYTSIGGTAASTVYNSGQALTSEGKYVITATDKAGNVSTATLYVDKTSPTFTASNPSKSSVKATFSALAHESPVTATVRYNNNAAVAYTSNKALTEPGRYIFTVTDRAGNSSTQTTYVDNTAPVLERSFEYGNSDGSVTFTRTDYESPVSAVYSYVGSGAAKTNVAYSSGQSLSADGEYTITATDGAGNISAVKLVVDRKAPILTFADGTTGAMQTTRGSSSVAWKAEKYESPISVVYSFISFDESIAPSLRNAAYNSGGVFTAEGTYEFTATDRAGNETQATVIIDNTPPTLTFSANGISFERYTNALFTANGADALSGVDKIELYENGGYNPYDFIPRSENGTYLFRLSDKAGNTTSATVTVYKTDTFGNLAQIRDAYKINAWYTVTLPARIFTTDSRDVAGRYSFESYERALEFAMQNERAFRVTAVQGGFMYVSMSNEGVAQKYDDEATLNAAVEKYAKGYISTRQISVSNGNDKYYSEPESLTRNSPILPDYLLELKDLPKFFAKAATSWSLPNISYISAMPYTVIAKYLGDYTEETTQRESVIPRGSALGSIADYRQGWYLITESDAAGNVETYLVYSDAELPTARATATRGDGEQDLTLDYAYTRNETLYFISLELKSILDNADPFVTLKIEKGSTVKYFTQSDELPTLGSDEFTSGKYTVTVFDRSLNALTFDVFIAGATPTMTHGSLAADKPDCKISFVTSDRYNVITGITLYKIEYDGTKTVLDTDGVGTPITAATLSYTLTDGGKYGATVTDNYRRTLELDPIFFLKGLPSGRLSGVADGGRTNNNVSFTFASADVCELYVLLPGGERRPFTDFTVQTGSADKTYNITASELTSFEYLVFLHNAQDQSLFVEYTFEIDTILPTFEITDSDGNIIEPDGATNKSFSIKWSETGVNMRYYTAKGGSLSAGKYNMNAVLSQGTLYYFTIKDDVGNTLDFTVLLDNAVDYVLDGKYSEIDGVMYANSALTFTVNEPTQEFSVVNADGYTIDNGGTLTQAGRYDITVTDNYRNTVTLAVVLDFTPPSLTLVGADNGAAVKNNVAVSAFDYDYLYLADNRGNKLKDISDGEIFSGAGVYYITARDYAGNSATVSFSIDLSVDYTLSVPSGAVTTEKVTLDTSEPLDIVVMLNGAAIESTTKFTDCGEYELTLTDALGNSVSCVFTIISSKGQTLNQALPAGTNIVRVLRNGEPFELADANMLVFDTTGVYTVTLDCGGTLFELTVETDNTPPVVTLTKDGSNVKVTAVDKENVELKLTLDGSEINCRVGQTLDEPGHYVLTATDVLGNVAVYEFDIPFRLNTWAIVAICVGGVVVIVVLILVIRARRKPRMK